ncbi:BspA family leucine-rich repeat surface protein [Candidatus Haliotispira prima]|uniref:BspA family leucine-rich repeat surface protein n=1 Tax=Candidatus Haliotispira prima TaxID=3034016 RepID=A0ABY8MDZ1_9SPIO|nr:BspA family leucine-rich repeat surface protein [Candidatus Haliotispira prima]
MKHQKQVLTDIGINSIISNIQYPISNIQYPISRTFPKIFPIHSVLFSVFFIHLFLASCTDLGTGSSTGKKILHFDTDGGSAVPSVEVPSGGLTLSKTMTAPTKDPSGTTTYYFGDWYTVDAATGHTGKTKFDYTKPITGSMTLYARWYTEQPADRAALEKLITDLGDTANFNHIDVRNISDMNKLFFSKGSFNGEILGWDVSSVINMNRMFSYTGSFNQPIGDWNVSKVTNMNRMFFSTRDFDQDISGWTVSQVTDFEHIFTSCKIKTAYKPLRFQ